MLAKGSFEVDLHREPPFDTADGVALSRASLDKRFSGALQGTSKGQMLSALTPTQGSAAYVAIERIEIVPDSGTGELRGIAGKMVIQIVEGRHFYEMEYTLPE